MLDISDDPVLKHVIDFLINWEIFLSNGHSAQQGIVEI